MTPDQEHKMGTRIWFVALWILATVACLLSGCLTAAKIGEWQRAVYDWGMYPGASKPCQVASAKASAYLAKSDTDLLSMGKLTDLASDSRARELINSAALACGKVAP
jgi:isocitrate lyase